MNKITMKTTMMAALFLSCLIVKAQTPVLADLTLLKALKIPFTVQDEKIGVGYAVISPEVEARLSDSAHLLGRCGNYEALNSFEDVSISDVIQQMSEIRKVQEKNDSYKAISFRSLILNFNPDIQSKVDLVNEQNVKDFVIWLSSYQNRYNKGKNPNVHVFDMQRRIETMLSSTKATWNVSTIDHKSTPQKSLRVQLVGKERPNEIVVLGAHLDSISNDFNDRAPGADDNASGSSSILEALRILADGPQTERTLEFFFYAGEESGLLGSSEIAKSYKNQSKDVVAVMQLDMTMYPGSGELVISSINDNTSAWLQDYLKELNNLYTKVKIVDDYCGYACSDHASWYKNGFPTFFPFESATDVMNRNLHTINDVASAKTSFKHASIFSKIAVAFALDMSNSQQRQPY